MRRLPGNEIDLTHLKSFEGAVGLEKYVTNYRRADVPQLEVAPPHDLFPDRPRVDDYVPPLTWDDPWTHRGRAGVYLAFSDHRKLIYVGTSQSLNDRLYHYFGGGATCVLKHYVWPILPRYIVTVAVPTGMEFEAPALELFLIRELLPDWNVIGKSADAI